MCIYNDKGLLEYALKKIDVYVLCWHPKYRVFTLEHENKIPEIWNLILIKTDKKYLVTDVQEISSTEGKDLKQVTREKLIRELKDFEDLNYKIYYKQLDQHLVGYLLDLFIYYIEMPDKIITDEEENMETYKIIKK